MTSLFRIGVVRSEDWIMKFDIYCYIYQKFYDGRSSADQETIFAQS